MKFIFRNFLLFIFIFFSQKNFAQHTIALNDQFAVSSDFFCNNSAAHSSVKPFLGVDLREDKITGDSAAQLDFSYARLTWKNYYYSTQKIPGTNNWPPESFDAGNQRPTAFVIRPVYEAEAGSDAAAHRTLESFVGGAIIDADYKQKLGIELRAAAGTAVLPNYLDSVAKFSGVMPGWGDRAYSEGNGKYAWQHFSGNLIWRPSKVFNLQIGRDKHFWGDGYRSLFLSDIGPAFPYIQQQTTIWHLQYTSMFAWLQDWTASDGAKSTFRNKFATFHYLSWNATKWLNLGAFESIVWQGEDSNRYRGFDPNYLDPMVFFRPIEFSVGSPDNAMLGFAFKVRLNRNNQLYGQLMLDEFYLKEVLARTGWWANKQGVQFGYKCFNFGQVDNLFLQAEVNIVRPYTYSHGSPQQSYSNAGMPLADPFGANFAEVDGILGYHLKGFEMQGKLVIAHFGLDKDGKDYGQNIFISYMDHFQEFNNIMFQGLKTTEANAELKLSYRLNTSFPIRFEIVGGARYEKNKVASQKSAYVLGGLSLPLWRSYRDY